MNDSKCPHCGEDMVWSGDMLTGGLVCKTDHYADAGYDTEGATPEQRAIVQKAMQDYLSQPSAAGKLADNIAKNNELIKRLEKSFVSGEVSPKTEEYPCDYVNDRCNFSEGGRNSGRTTRMLKAAMKYGGPGTAYCVFHQHHMIPYAANLLKKMDCRTTPRSGILITPLGKKIALVSKDDLRYRTYGESGRLFYDHMVEWRWVNVR